MAAIDAKELAIIARYSKGRAAAEKFYALTTPNNVLALVEALEKTQTKAIEQGRTACELFDEVTALRQRIAELESRAVTVKLPESFKLAKSSSGLTYYYADEVDAALTAAGIKVEAE
ncbi:hypothetical protein [Klebsiella pneumoniae]|uniref:hypothetical protein n=1 Tax=Klebsiella pneumoniae TaxID=573 RepID=UPI001D17C769|nr:hypothetical protein [Klebsiella pneumoniae]